MVTSKAYGSARGRLDDLIGVLEPDERSQLMILDAAENEKFEAVSLNRFPHSEWTGIDWDHSAFSEQVFTSGEPEAAQLISGWLSLVPADGLAVVFWGNVRVPAVAMPVGCAARNAEEILYTSDDVWLFVVDEGFLIEYLHDGRLTAAHVPGV
ncbi:hypothetical protein [Streptomyces sp. NPDC001068]|uniref:CDI toxin immunity protein n=1 Tax=Streptomyces sp. NPDC001068 TaxID=3364544 RepID=UPI0036786236